MIISTKHQTPDQFLARKLECIAPDPEGLQKVGQETHAHYLFQALRHERFGRFKSMSDTAKHIRNIIGEDKSYITSSYEGIAALAQGDFNQAFESLKGAAHGAPHLWIHHYNCGVLIIRAHADPAVAATCFERAIAIFAEQIEPWEGLALAALQMEAWDRSTEAARRALAMSGGRSLLGALCLTAAQERLSLPIEALSFKAEAPAPQDELRIDDDHATVMTLALDDNGVDEALRLADSIARSAPGWRLHLVAVNLSPCAQLLLNTAVAEGRITSWSAETMAAPTQDELHALASWTMMWRLRTLSSSAGAPLLLVPSSTLLCGDPSSILPSEDEGVAVILQDGLPWSQVSGQVVAIRRGSAAHAFLNEALEGMAGPWRSTPFAVRLGLWRALQLHGARRLTDADVSVLAEGPPPGDAASTLGVNEVLQSRFGPMVLNRHDLYVTAGVRETGSWSADELDLLSQLIRPGQTVLDVGANMGSHTLAFCTFVGAQGRVYAFEPQRVMFQAMVASIALNSWTNAWCHMAAVGSAPGVIEVPDTVYDEPSNFGLMSLTPGWQGAGNLKLRPAKETVPVMTVDGLQLPACHLLKIDVEGMEQEVLAGAADTLRRLRPIVYMECHRGPHGEPASLSFLKQFDYRAWWHGHEGSRNVVAFPKERAPITLGLEEA